MTEDAKIPLSTLTGARQTMASWSKVIESYDAIPSAYKSFLKPYAGNAQSFPYTILTPSQDKFLHKTTEKLTYDSDDAIHILERIGSRVTAKSYPYKDIHSVEVGNILLSSWITVSGLTSEGVASSSTIDFNAATGERLFAVFLKRMRPTPCGVGEAAFEIEKSKFDYLAELNFKFMNYGRSSLVRGENVSQVILQPKIREPAWKFAGWTLHRTLSPAHLAILTDKELILIRDDERVKEIKGARYGGVWQYIPLRKIRSVKLTEISSNLLELVITFPFGEAIKRVFSISSKTDLEKFRDKIKEMAG
jgi:hypothetical protein